MDLTTRFPPVRLYLWALQYVFTIFTGSMTGSIMLASGAGMNSADTAFLIQCGLFACCITTLIQSLGIRIVQVSDWRQAAPGICGKLDPHHANGAVCQ